MQRINLATPGLGRSGSRARPVRNTLPTRRWSPLRRLPRTRGSRGLTLYSRFPSNRVNPSVTAAPSSAPPATNAKPRDITSRNRFDAPTPSAMRRRERPYGELRSTLRTASLLGSQTHCRGQEVNEAWADSLGLPGFGAPIRKRGNTRLSVFLLPDPL
jgi:hypothetical protein